MESSYGVRPPSEVLLQLRTRDERKQLLAPDGDRVDGKASGGHTDAGEGVDHVVVAGRDDDERHQRSPRCASSFAPRLQAAATPAKLSANAKPTCRLGTAANAI